MDRHSPSIFKPSCTAEPKKIRTTFPRIPYSWGSGCDLVFTILVPSHESLNVQDGSHFSVASVVPDVQQHCRGVWFIRGSFAICFYFMCYSLILVKVGALQVTYIIPLEGSY